ncbi:hypothetical protein [Kitasatospora sp. CB02891]|uniref:hypothetical protein n=1 Tax=Kitasatospora sp. CB02891 TaxID=2020329 RepID=UPI000C2733FE|nr:hypothetical protein [Kitasatospora sp. CB02891]PJN25657.1 hypothetical protein CG736_14860 [Kitasatospora sp. CB02891]
MAGRGEVQRIRIGEEVLVVLPEREYEALLANRRQVGGCTARVRALQHALAEALSRLAAAEGAGAADDGAPDVAQ